MLKFKITPERCAEALQILEYLALTRDDLDTGIRVAPRFLLNGDDDYKVHIKFDEDGDITDFENVGDALLAMTVVTPKRLEALARQICEATKQIVNPRSGGGSTGPTPTATEKPLPG